MPLHLESITRSDHDEKLIQHLFEKTFHDCGHGLTSADKRFLVTRCGLTDELSGEAIGAVTFTLANGEEGLEMLDIDLTLSSAEPVELTLLKRLEQSSEANEYYDAELPGKGQRLQIETVCRYAVEGGIEGKTLPAYVSAFPFRLSLYDSIEAFNSELCCKDAPEFKLSSSFIAPGGIFAKGNRGEVFSFILGTVESFREARLSFGETQVDFVIAQVETALGTIPVPMSREVFDLGDLAPGKLIAMYADIKADLSKPSDFAKI
jgi:hypothetical protein